MRIAVNLATRPFADLGPSLKRLRIAMGVLVLVALGFGWGLHALHNKAQAARAREHSLDGAIAKINQEKQGAESMVREPANAAVLGQAASLNKLIDAKAFSWTLAMEDLETVLPGGVQVTTLEPSVAKKDGHITVRLRVIGPRDKAVELVQNLEHSRHFLQPRITGESSETNANGNQALQPVSASSRVNFDLLADYNPATPQERKAAHHKTEGAQNHEEGAPEAATVPRSSRTGRAGQRRPYTGPQRAIPVRPGGRP